jgi:CheY-like chemotaxis protein
MNIKDQKKLGIGTALVPVGHSFMILKLNKVPRCPSVMEMGGQVSYVDDRSGGLVLGLVFEKSEFSGALRNMVSSRAGSIPSAVPPKARRKTVMDEPEPEPAARPEKPIEAVKPPEPIPAPPPPPPTPAPKPEAAPPSEAPSANRNNPLLRLKKRSRTVLVLSSAGHGEMLRDHFLEEGYGRVLVAVGWDEVVAHLQEPGNGVFLVDTERPVLESLEMVQRLAEAGMELPPIILAAEEVSRSLVLAAHRVGVSQLLVKPYALDDDFSLLIEQQMGLA